MRGIFQKENANKARKYGIYRHLPTYEKIIRNLVSFLNEKISDEEIKQLKKLPIFFIYSRDDDVVAPETHELPTIRRLLGAGASNVHTFVSKHVIDTSGRFNDKDGEPLRYSGHWSWIYFFNNEAVSDRCGIRVWQWMAQQLK